MFYLIFFKAFCGIAIAQELHGEEDGNEVIVKNVLQKEIVKSFFFVKN